MGGTYVGAYVDARVHGGKHGVLVTVSPARRVRANTTDVFCIQFAREEGALWLGCDVYTAIHTHDMEGVHNS